MAERPAEANSLVLKSGKYLRLDKLHLRSMLNRNRYKNWKRDYQPKWMVKRAEYLGVQVMLPEEHLCFSSGVVVDNYGREAVPMLRLLLEMDDLHPALQIILDRIGCTAGMLVSKDGPAVVEKKFNQMMLDRQGPSRYMKAKHALESRLRLEFFMAKILRKTAISWPPGSSGPQYQWLRVVNVQGDGSVKAQSKKLAYQVYLLCGNTQTKKTTQLLSPLPLQIQHQKGGKKKVHEPAASRAGQLLRVLSYATHSDFLEEIAANAEPVDGLREVIVMDGDQEATEQRAMSGLGQKFPLVPRIGLMHRASNCSAGNKKVRQLQIALRILTGGKASSKSLRGLFKKCYTDLREKVAAGWEPPEKEQIQRETGKTLEEAYAEGGKSLLVSLVRARWFGPQYVASWAAKNGGICFTVLNEMEAHLVRAEETGEDVLVEDPDDGGFRDDSIEDDQEVEEAELPLVDDLYAEEADQPDDGAVVFEQVLQEDRQLNHVPESEDLEKLDDDALAKMTDLNKVRAVKKRLLSLSEDDLLHFNRLHRRLFLWHLLHQKKTFGRQADAAAFTEERQQYMAREFPRLWDLSGTSMTDAMKATSTHLPVLIGEAIQDACGLCRTHQQSLEAIHMMRLCTRWWLYESFDPVYNLWNSVFRRKDISEAGARDLLANLHTETGRKPWVMQRQFQHYCAKGLSRTAEEMATRILISGATSDGEGESFWRYASTAALHTGTADRQYKLNFARTHEWQKRCTIFPEVPSFLPPSDRSQPPSHTSFRETIRDPQVRTLEEAAEIWKPEKMQGRDDYITEYGKHETIQDTQPLTATLEQLLEEAKKIILDSTGPLEGSAQTYHLPGLEVAVLLRTKPGRTREQRRVVKKMGQRVDETSRHSQWLKRKSYLVYKDEWLELLAMVLEITRGMYVGVQLEADELEETAKVPEKITLVFGYTADCSTLNSYNNIQYASGRLVFDLTGGWTLFVESLRVVVGSLTPEEVREALAYYLEADVPDHPVTAEYRDHLRAVLGCKDADVAKMRWLEFTKSALGAHGSLDDDPEYQRVRERLTTANRGGGSNGGKRTFLGYVPNDFHFGIYCGVCRTAVATVHKFERRASGAGRALLLNWRIPIPEKMAQYPTTYFPLHATAEMRIKAAFFPACNAVHRLQKKCRCPLLAVRKIDGNRKTGVAEPMEKIAVPEEQQPEPLAPAEQQAASSSSSSSSSAAAAPLPQPAKAPQPVVVKAKPAQSAAAAAQQAASSSSSSSSSAAPAPLPPPPKAPKPVVQKAKPAQSAAAKAKAKAMNMGLKIEKLLAAKKSNGKR